MAIESAGPAWATWCTDPALEPWTVAVHHLGPLGAGQVGKTVNNLCHWAQIAAVHEAHPDVHIWTAALDRELDDNAFIRPGLGDAGDRVFGTAG